MKFYTRDDAFIIILIVNFIYERGKYMWTIGELKAKGKMAFKANYWKCVLTSFILAFLTGASASTSSSSSDSTGSTDELVTAFNGLSTGEQMAAIGIAGGVISIALIIGLIIRIFIYNPLLVGCNCFFKENVATSGKGDLGALKEGFGNYLHNFLTLFLSDLFLALWFCLLVVPGLIKMYSYRMVPYIVKDNPELSPIEVITKSREMMNGHKWRAFLLDLSFIGWMLLSAITLGVVGIFWTGPYKDNTNAALYLELSKSEYVYE